MQRQDEVALVIDFYISEEEEERGRFERGRKEVIEGGRHHLSGVGDDEVMVLRPTIHREIW